MDDYVFTKTEELLAMKKAIEDELEQRRQDELAEKAETLMKQIRAYLSLGYNITVYNRERSYDKETVVSVSFDDDGVYLEVK